MFFEATITLIPKLHKDITKKKTQANFPREHSYKNSKQNFIKSIQQHIRKIILLGGVFKNKSM